MKKIIASIAALAIACTMSLSAFAETVNSDKTIAEGETYSQKQINVMSFGSTAVTFTNNGFVQVDSSFSLYHSNFVNNGEFLFLGHSFSTGDPNDGSVFTNNGTLIIDANETEQGTFSIAKGSTLENTGVIKLVNVTNYNLDGTLFNSGYIVYDENNVNAYLINKLKEKYPNVLSMEKYEALTGSVTTLPNSRKQDVKAKYVPGEEAGIVYSVDVEWGAMEFTYTAANEGEWDPDTHTYENKAAAGWTAEGNSVKVTNHSNAPVLAEFEYSNAAGFEGLTGTMSVTEYTLKAGVEDEYENADNVTSELTLSGDLPSTAENFTKVGEVTVVLSEPASIN